MKMSGLLAVCLLAVLPLAASAQESSKISATTTGIDVVDLITRFAKRTGKQFAIDSRVRAQVPLANIDPGQVTYEQLLAILDIHQLAVSESGGVIAVVPDAGARQFPTPVYTDKGFKALDHEFVTLLVQPKNVCAEFLVPVLRPLMPQAAHLAAEIQTNTLIISDHAGNARRISELVEQIDKRGTGKKECPATVVRVTGAPPAPKPAG